MEREIEKYISELKGKQGLPAGKSERSKTFKALSVMMAILKERGQLWPDDSDYAEYRERSTCDERGTRQNVARVEKFFAWLRKEKSELAEEYVQHGLFSENGAVVKEPETLGAFETDTVQVIEEPETDSNDAETSIENEPSRSNEEMQPPTRGGKRSNAGRKRLEENGEIRSEKITVYMTPSTAADFQALCLLKHASSVTDYVLGLIKGEISKNAKALSFFREAEKLIE